MWATLEGEQVLFRMDLTELPGHLSPRALELWLFQVWMQSAAGTYQACEKLAEEPLMGKWVCWSVVG
jgi:hypothetical protein